MGWLLASCIACWARQKLTRNSVRTWAGFWIRCIWREVEATSCGIAPAINWKTCPHKVWEWVYRSVDVSMHALSGCVGFAEEERQVGIFSQEFIDALAKHRLRSSYICIVLAKANFYGRDRIICMVIKLWQWTKINL